MTSKWRFVRDSFFRAFVCSCVVTSLFSVSSAFADGTEQSDNTQNQPARFRVESLKFISAQQAREYLDTLQVVTASQLANTNKLLLTGQAKELIMASALLNLVDAKGNFVIKHLLPLKNAETMPSNKEIQAELSDISIGTFTNQPVDDGPGAIIDIYKGMIIVVAPADKIEKITETIEKLQETKTEAVVSVTPEVAELEPNQINEPNQTNELDLNVILDTELQKIAAHDESISQPKAKETEPDDLFDRLVESLEDVRKSQIESQLAETDANEPNEQPADFQQAGENPSPPVAEQLKQVDVAAILKRLEALEVKSKLEAEQIEVEEPEEIVEPAVVSRSYAPESVDIAEHEFELDLPEKLPIIDLLDLVGKYLNLDYMYNEADMKGKEVSLKIQGPIKVKELYPMLEAALKFQGFVMARKDNLVTIVPTARAMEIDAALVDSEKGKVRYGDVIVTRIFRLKYIDTASAKNLLAGMKLGADITPIEATGTLIITEYAYRMERIEELLALVDKPGEPRQFRFRQLRYTMAAILAPKVKTLAEQLGEVSISIAEAAAKPEPAPRRGRKPAPKKPAAPTPAAGAAESAVYLDADERTNRILMIGTKSELDVVEELIDTLDVIQQDLRTLRLYDIQHVGAEEVMDKLSELGIISGGVETSRYGSRGRRTESSRTAKAAQPATETRISAGEVEEALAGEPQVVVIESTNSLLVNATDDQHEQIAIIIGYVDSETLQEAIPYEIYPLENQSPEDLAGVLNQLIQETTKDKEGKIEKVTKTEEDIVIVGDESTFSLIVYASRKNQEWIEKLIKQLDKRRPQVLIDVTLVEISKTDTFTYDLDLVSSFPDLATTSGMASVAAIQSGTIQTALEAAHRDRFLDFSSSSTGTGKGFYADHHIQALLTLMQKKDYGRVLAKPKILVNDNEKGTISTEQTTYVSRSASTTQLGETDAISTSFSFDEFASGITLDITPHISEGDLLRLEITMNRSTQDSAGGTNAPPPDKTTNNINTIVTVPDDSTIILGGILTLDQDKDGAKVPILGDIPLIGGLFRSIDNSNTESKLYIFVKANILRPSEREKGLPDLERISERNRLAFEKHEKNFQEYEQWTGIKSEPMDPLKVLEAE